MSIFYKITAPNGAISYLFGTLHINHEDICTLPLEVKRALEQAAVCVFETDNRSLLANPWATQILNSNWLSEQEQYFSQIPKDYVESARRNLKKIYQIELEANPEMAPALDMMLENVHLIPPIQIAQPMMSEEEVATKKLSNGLDEQLVSYAMATNKNIGYLEQPEAQVSAALGYNFNILEQIEFYRFIELELAKGRKFPNLSDNEIAYKLQDAQRLRDNLKVFPPNFNLPAIVRQYYDALTINRELKMAEEIRPFLESGNAFIAVGAGHLKGITDKLQREGYTIEAVPFGRRCYPIEGSIEDCDNAFRTIYTTQIKPLVDEAICRYTKYNSRFKQTLDNPKWLAQISALRESKTTDELCLAIKSIYGSFLGKCTMLDALDKTGVFRELKKLGYQFANLNNSKFFEPRPINKQMVRDKVEEEKLTEHSSI